MNPDNTASSQAPTSFRAALLAMLGIGLVNMLIALDQTVVSTALPSIISDLHGFEYYAWMASSYLLTSVVAVPIFGRLGDFFGRKPFILAAILIFTLASLLCGVAPTMFFLILARGLQGIGGGMMIGTAFASIPDMFPEPRDRLRWQMVLAAAYAIGTGAGPSLGGFLSQQFGWRSTFLVNLPVGIIALYVVYKFLPLIRRPRTTAVRIDWVGALLIAIVLGCTQSWIENLAKPGSFGLEVVLGLIVVIGAAAFIYCEKRVALPIVPLNLFGDRQLNIIFLLSFLAGFAMFSLIFFIPLLLQGGFSLSPQQAGLIATPLPLFVAVGSLINTRVVIRLRRPANILTAGFTCLLLSCIGVALTFPSTGYTLIVLANMLGGIGLGLILNNMNIFAQEISGRENLGIATAIAQSTRMVGGMFGTALVGLLVSARYQSAALDLAAHRLSGPAGDRLAALVSQPRNLLEPDLRDQLVHNVDKLGVSGIDMLDACRMALISAVHSGVLLTAAVIVAAILLVQRILDVQFSRKNTPSQPSQPH